MRLYLRFFDFSILFYGRFHFHRFDEKSGFFYPQWAF